MKHKSYKGDVSWRIPGKKKPIAYSTKATSDCIVVLGEETGLKLKDLINYIHYDQEAKNILQKYIDLGYGDKTTKEMNFR